MVLLVTAALLFVQIVATTTKEAMGAEDYVRPAMLDVGVGVVRPSMRCAAVGGRTVRQKRGSPTVLMVGAVVLSNGAEMLLVGNVLVFMHNVGHVIDRREHQNVHLEPECAGTMFWDQGGVCGAIFSILADVW